MLIRPASLLIVVCVACGVFGGIGAAPAGGAGPAAADPKDTEIAALRAQVLQQSAEIKRLQAQLAEAKAKPPLGNLLIVPPQAATAPAPLAPQWLPQGQAPLSQPAQVPPGWSSHEFNGITYYVVPLGEKK